MPSYPCLIDSSNMQHFIDKQESRLDFRTDWKRDTVPNIHEINYSSPFNFEKDLDYTKIHTWFQKNWTLSIFSTGLYLLAIYYGRKYMSYRDRFTLKPYLACWNVLLAVFSLCGAIRMWQVMIGLLAARSFKATVCFGYFTTPISNFWSLLFILSKLPELLGWNFNYN